MFFTLNRSTLQLNMLFSLEHVFHAEPFNTSAKHALAGQTRSVAHKCMTCGPKQDPKENDKWFPRRGLKFSWQRSIYQNDPAN
ncbi:MAG: hypothetical protein H6875_05350 [Hyphomicrobiaceae bacterium]|nr:hypothetical protein [Hyphomicrobiaceae bacterium]